MSISSCHSLGVFAYIIAFLLHFDFSASLTVRIIRCFAVEHNDGTLGFVDDNVASLDRY